jgi:hypothetical protein
MCGSRAARRGPPVATSAAQRSTGMAPAGTTRRSLFPLTCASDGVRRATTSGPPRVATASRIGADYRAGGRRLQPQSSLADGALEHAALVTQSQVLDGEDRCPGTPLGELVDAEGCSTWTFDPATTSGRTMAGTCLAWPMQQRTSLGRPSSTRSKRTRLCQPPPSRAAGIRPNRDKPETPASDGCLRGEREATTAHADLVSFPSNSPPIVSCMAKSAAEP